jgi:hypothetical protein
MPRTLPDHLQQHAPKRSDYESREDYEEALAYFRHRFRHLARPTPSRSKGSRSE